VKYRLRKDLPALKFVEGSRGGVLYKIELLRDIPNIGKIGDLGGWIEKGSNLSQDGDAWVYGDAQVYGDARVSGNAWVSGNAEVYGDARVSGNTWVYEDARVYGSARVSGDARVYGDAQVYGDARVSGNMWVYGNERVSEKPNVSKKTVVKPVYKNAVFYEEANGPKFNKPLSYREEVLKNAPFMNTDSTFTLLSRAGLGIAGEAGETADLIKKVLYHQVPLESVREKLIKEMGDVYWYLEYLGAVLDVTTQEVLEANVAKLKARHPNGWTPQSQREKKDEQS